MPKDVLNNAYDFLSQRLGNARDVVSKGYGDLSKYLEKNPDMRRAVLNTALGGGAGIVGSAFLRDNRTAGNYLKDALIGAAGANMFDVQSRLNGVLPSFKGVPGGGGGADKPKTPRNSIQSIARTGGKIQGGALGGMLGLGMGRGVPFPKRLGGRWTTAGLGALMGAYGGSRLGGRTADWLTDYEG